MVAYAAAYARIRLSPRSATFQRPETSGKPRYRLTACVRVKNEGRFLPEMLAHHCLLGFEHFYLYDNNSTDEPAKVLAPFVQRGLVTIVPWPDVPAAPSCYRHFFENFETEAEWVAFIDADEFIVERMDGALSAALARLASKAALGINYRYFGSSGHLSIPDGLIMEAFRRCDPRLDGHVKVIIRPKMALSYFNPHNFIYRNGALTTSVGGRPIFGTFSRAGADSPIELHHYIYRSREDYVAKIGLGFADSAGYKHRYRRIERLESEFVKHNVVDGSWAAEKYGPNVRRFLQELSYPEKYCRTCGDARAQQH
jgi:Glycosyltransferase family 92